MVRHIGLTRPGFGHVRIETEIGQQEPAFRIVPSPRRAPRGPSGKQIDTEHGRFDLARSRFGAGKDRRGCDVFRRIQPAAEDLDGVGDLPASLVAHAPQSRQPPRRDGEQLADAQHVDAVQRVGRPRP